MRTLNLSNAAIFSCLLGKFVHLTHNNTVAQNVVVTGVRNCLSTSICHQYLRQFWLSHPLGEFNGGNAGFDTAVFCVLPFTSAQCLLNIIILSPVHVNKLASLWLRGSGRRGGGRGRRGLGDWMPCITLIVPTLFPIVVASWRADCC